MVKRFGEVAALAGVDLVVGAGSLTALLGPNGAGKTTLVRIIATLTRPDAGRVRVVGFDVVTRPAQVRARIGLTGQYAGLDESLTGRDNLILIGRLAGLARRQARERAAEFATRLGLAEAVARPVRTYSGGMRRRLDLAASLMARPALLILDEPTTGLDPVSRSRLWATLADLRAEGATMLLTTQYLEEADRFADVAHVLDHGQIVASGAPSELKARAGRQAVEVQVADPALASAAARVLARRVPAAFGDVGEPDGSGRLSVLADDGVNVLIAAASALAAAGIAVADLGVRRPSLDEVFLALTGAPGVSA